MDENNFAGLRDDILRGRLSRRAVLRRAAGLGLGASAMALLAACGGGESPETAATTPPDTGGGETPTSNASPTTGTGDATATAPSETGSAEIGPIEEAQNKGGTVTEGGFSDAKTVNPVLVSDTASGRISDLMFNSVMTVDPSNAEPKVELAESFEVSDDGLSYTFLLRDGVTFHDGETLTAQDVKFTYDLLMNPDTGSPRTSELTARVESVEAVDDQTVEVTLTAPDASFLVSHMLYGIVPEHALKDVNPAELAQHPFSTGEKGTSIGSGPFMFEEWVKDDHLTLTKFADYWEGEPHLDQYVRRVVADSTVIPQVLRTGEIDFGQIDEAAVEDMKTAENINLVQIATFDFTFYAYQLDTEKTTLFQDKEVRQALLYALDRQAMIEAIRFGIGEVATGTVPTLSWAYNPDGIELKYEYDPDKAEQLLDQAGWTVGSDGIREKDGQRLAFSVYTNAGNTVREQYLTVMQEAWKKIGVEMTPQTEEWNAFIDRITGTKDFEIFLVGFSWGVDPDQSTMWRCDSYEGGFNMNKYCNPDVDSLLEQGLQTTDQAERTKIYTELQNLLMEDLPSAILDFPKDTYGVNKRVHNLFPNDIDIPFNAHQWWVDA